LCDCTAVKRERVERGRGGSYLEKKKERDSSKRFPEEEGKSDLVNPHCKSELHLQIQDRKKNKENVISSEK